MTGAWGWNPGSSSDAGCPKVPDLFGESGLRGQTGWVEGWPQEAGCLFNSGLLQDRQQELKQVTPKSLPISVPRRLTQWPGEAAGAVPSTQALYRWVLGQGQASRGGTLGLPKDGSFPCLQSSFIKGLWFLLH